MSGSVTHQVEPPRCLQQPASLKQARIIEPRGHLLAERDGRPRRHAEQDEVFPCPGRHLL
jgi:hypothetical protein